MRLFAKRSSGSAEEKRRDGEHGRRRDLDVETGPEDALVATTVARIGADHVVWASDFPHPDAVFPGAVDEFVAEAGLDSTSLDAVLWKTPRAFYRLEARFGCAMR